MLKKLKKQFILSSLIPILFVIIFAFCALTLITYSYERSQTVTALRSVLDGNINTAFFPNEEIIQNLPKGDTRGKNYNEERLSSVELIAIVDKNKEVALWEASIYSDIDKSSVIEYINEALESVDKTKGTETVGIISREDIRYLVIETSTGYKIAFSDRSSETETMVFMLRVFAFVGMAIMALMFVIADFMARKAIEPVEKSWDEQNRFVADASHELKTPLTVILANMDIMQANKDQTVWEQNKWIENTKSEATRMTELVNDMLFLARSDAHAPQSYNFQETNFSNLAGDCVLTFESVAFEKGINLSSNIPLDLYAVLDETRIKQVIMVLLDNALKYVNENGSIFVAAESNQRQIKFTVANTGTPIPKEKQEHLFERFYRVDDSRAREKGGYGLGLAIAQNIMAAHGGSIGLEYSNEKGTCFAITIPLKQAERGRHGISLRK